MWDLSRPKHPKKIQTSGGKKTKNVRLHRVLWYGLGRPVITSKIGNWSILVLFGWRFVFGMIVRWERRDPSCFRCHHDSGNNKAASLLLLLRFSKRKWVAPRTSLIGRRARGYSVFPPSLQGDTLCLYLFTSQMASSAGRKKTSTTFIRVFPGFIPLSFRGVGLGFEETHLRLMF